MLDSVAGPVTIKPDRVIDVRHKGFLERSVEARTASGVPFSNSVRAGMPKIPPTFLKCTFYLYATEEDARAGKKIGGTGFFVAIPSQESPKSVYTIAVSNWHVVCRRGFSVIRVNKLDGGIDIFDLQPDQWQFIPSGFDIAVVPARVDTSIHDVAVAPIAFFFDQAKISQTELGPGEDVFMWEGSSTTMEWEQISPHFALDI